LERKGSALAVSFSRLPVSRLQDVVPGRLSCQPKSFFVAISSTSAGRFRVQSVWAPTFVPPAVTKA